ncbi:MAG: hypothetical protein ACREVI_03850 [Steroidobacteraceae bacterium]
MHRRSGSFFVYAMLVMATGGLLVAAVRGVAPAINIPIALLTAYLVVTSLATVRPPKSRGRELLIGAMLIAFGFAVAKFAFALDAIAREEPPFGYLPSGVIALLAGVGDMRILRSRTLPQGAGRLARHLWRMCLALLIAALSFFIGQSDELPEPVRIYLLLALPMVVVLGTMIFWLWRIRTRRFLAPRTG